VGSLLGCLALWIYLPVSGKSSQQIAVALLEYRNVTQTNGLGALGKELPGSLMLYHNWNPSRESGRDFAETGYYYYRLGIYFERRFDLKRDFPGGNTWALTTTVRACPPMTHREYWWTQQLLSITNGAALGGQSSTMPSDAVIKKSLPGTWHLTGWASYNGWNAIITIASNGDCSCIENSVGGDVVGKEFGTVRVENGFLIMTITNCEPRASELPYTTRQQIIYADERNVLTSHEPFPGKMLLERKTE